MASGEDFLLRPVTAGMCHYESLKNGTIDLLDVTKMNEALDVQSANQNIARNIK
ncbi:MAG: hypothetical protein KGI08_09120 [Thaumarchaeota archaeon]|nr:hypothetical protein [Nitrososphaerota archaeon]